MTTPPGGPPHPAAGSGPVHPDAGSGAGHPGAESAAAAPARRRRARLVAALAAAVAGALLGGGLLAWTLREPDPGGAPDPVTAVQAFLDAVYRDRDPSAATALVCPEARDVEAMTARIATIDEYAGADPAPVFSWDHPRVVARSDTAATIEVTVRVSAAGGPAAETPLRVQVRDPQGRGWWVCQLESVRVTPGGALR